MTVESVLSSSLLNLSFRRILVGEKLVEWQELGTKVAQVNLNDERDLFPWNLHSSGKFTVHSMYQFLMNQNAHFNHKLIWKLKVPLKIKIYFWYLQKDVI